MPRLLARSEPRLVLSRLHARRHGRQRYLPFRGEHRRLRRLRPGPAAPPASQHSSPSALVTSSLERRRSALRVSCWPPISRVSWTPTSSPLLASLTSCALRSSSRRGSLSLLRLCAPPTSLHPCVVNSFWLPS